MQTTDDNQRLDLKVQCGLKLKLLKTNISPADKITAMVKLNLSRPTFSKYLSGSVAKLDTGEAILKHLSEKISTRTKSIQSY